MIAEMKTGEGKTLMSTLPGYLNAIERKGVDRYLVSNPGGDVNVDLNDGAEINPPYPVPTDYVPGGLTKMSIEVLGGASGFSTTEPCTGLALCYNGDYLLIDSIPFLYNHQRQSSWRG